MRWPVSAWVIGEDSPGRVERRHSPCLVLSGRACIQSHTLTIRTALLLFNQPTQNQLAKGRSAMPQPNEAVPAQPYTVIGYLDLFNIHTVYEHVEAATSDEAIE